MSYHDPAKDFTSATVAEKLKGGGDRAYNVVKGLSENQCRYALWATLVLLFGSPESNASEVLGTSKLPTTAASADLREGLLLLAEIGISRSRPKEVEFIREQVMAMREKP